MADDPVAKEWTTPSGIPLPPHLSPEGAEKPGAYPFTRGLYAEQYRRRLWTMRQYAGLATPEETNERFRWLLEHGQTGLSVAFDLPTQIGYDPDDPMAEDDVGKVGVSCASLADMEAMMAGIPLDKVSTSMTINATAPILLAFYLVAAEKQGVQASAVSGTLQNDLLKEFVARGTYTFPLEHSMRLCADVIAYCAQEVPRFNAISVSGYHMREAGCDAVEEAAYALSFARAYLDRVVARGLDVDRFAPRISWIFNTHNDLFEEVAKYRALRRIWATMLREDYGAKDPKSWMLRTHTQTGGSTLPAQQPENNIARATIQALAATLGGVQSLALSCFDEALAIPTEKAQQIALRTQQIVAHESGVPAVTDPLGGSYLVEYLTDELETRIRAEMKAVADLGGAEEAVRKEYLQRRIADAAARQQRAIESGDQVVVGVNRFTEDVDPAPPAIFALSTTGLAAAKERLADLRARRDETAVEATLTALRAAAEDPEVNLMPPILAAGRAYATLGEITGALADVFGRADSSTLV
ncbi:MAG: acyl-CoA mutase large subunit family protein [Thermoplasmatota archaeon]